MKESYIMLLGFDHRTSLQRKLQALDMGMQSYCLSISGLEPPLSHSPTPKRVIPLIRHWYPPRSRGSGRSNSQLSRADDE